MFQSIGISRLRMQIDGEGVTTLVAGTGCPLRCKYCLNPQCFTPGLPTKAWSVEALIDELKIDDLYFTATGGGVTFGGGEPLLQAEFIHAFREKCPAHWRIGLETSLNVPTESVRLIAQDIDEFIVDCKDMHAEIYEAYTGISNERMVKNLTELRKLVGTEKIHVRVPLIPNYNTEELCDESEAMLRAMGVTKVERFTYDQTRGADKLKAKS